MKQVLLFLVPYRFWGAPLFLVPYRFWGVPLFLVPYRFRDPISGPLSFSGYPYFWSPIVFGVPLFLVPYRFRGTPISGPLSFSGYPYFWSPIAFGGHPYFWSPIAVSKVWGELARFSTRFRNIRGGCTPETRHPPRMLRKRVENLASFPQPFRAQLVGVLARQISDLPR
jgi:hypothetical protein